MVCGFSTLNVCDTDELKVKMIFLKPAIPLQGFCPRNVSGNLFTKVYIS